MRTVVCDIEADSLNPTQIWCVVAYDLNSKTEHIFTAQDCLSGLRSFAEGVDVWIGHSFLTYDRPALNKLLGLSIKVKQVRDTLILSRLFNASRENGHSLKAWGEKFGMNKVEHEDWSKFSPEMLERCRVDVQLNVRLWNHLKDKEQQGYTDECIQLEHNIQYLLSLQEQNGVAFDYQKAHMLLSTCRKEADEIECTIHKYFKPKPKLVRVITPKFNKNGELSIVGLRKLGDDAKSIVGGAFSLLEWKELKLTSPTQLVERLNEAGWQPVVFNKLSSKMKKEGRKQGSPKVCEENLETLPDTAPEAAKLICKYLILNSRCTNIRTWFEALGSDNRIHGSVIGLGASTHRMAHRNPNTANIPSILTKMGKVALYGKECRECFTVEDKINRRIVGVDASGIQLRILAHYMNDEEYTKAVCEGKKEDGTDIHSVNMRAGNLDSRDIAKRFIYSFLLGAGNRKVEIITGKPNGGKVKQQFLDSLPSLARVYDMALDSFEIGYMVGLDGRRIQIPSAHKSLAMYLQGGEAVIIKKAYVFAYNQIKKEGLDAKFVLCVHDEYQLDCHKDCAERVGQIVVKAIKDAGKYYNLNCPLDGNYSIGLTWADSH